MSNFRSPAYTLHQPSDRPVADQIRPSRPVTCDGCNRVWQPGMVWWTRESQPLYRWCNGCRRHNEYDAQDWQILTEQDIREIAQADHEDGRAPADQPGSLYQTGSISRAADRVIREAQIPGAWNHISASQRRKHEARIKSEKREETEPMGKMSEEARRNISEAMRRSHERRKREAAEARDNGGGTVTITQEVQGRPETRTKTTMPIKTRSATTTFTTTTEPPLAEVLAAVAVLRRLSPEARAACLELIG